MPHPLDYHPAERPPRPTARQRRTVLIALLLGQLASLATFLPLAVGGPIFPFTVAHAPAAILLQLLSPTDAGVLFLVFVLAPLTYGLYGYLLASPHPRMAATAIATFHLLCFLIVCHLRAVTWPW